jgi:hypothetical protein
MKDLDSKLMCEAYTQVVESDPETEKGYFPRDDETLPPPEYQEPDPIEDEETWWQAFLDGRIRIPQLPKINWDPVDD